VISPTLSSQLEKSHQDADLLRLERKFEPQLEGIRRLNHHVEKPGRQSGSPALGFYMEEKQASSVLRISEGCYHKPITYLPLKE
jgi:hypothetical protein